MKLSEITKIKNFSSATIYILRNDLIVCEIFVIGRKRPIRKIYRKLEIDLQVADVGTYTVSHLGIKKYWEWKEWNGKKYINIYSYQL